MKVRRPLWLLAVALAAPLSARGPGPLALAAELSQAPRVPGTPDHGRAEALLLAEMRKIGLAEIGVDAGDGYRNLIGISPGRGEGEVVLAAHYDTVAASPGALDDASGCAVALAAMQALHALPHHRTVRLILFDGEEAGLYGSRGWVASLGGEERDAIVAAVVLEMVGDRDARSAVILDFSRSGHADGDHTPAWLVHAVRESGRGTGHRFRVASAGGGVAMQLVSRLTRSTYASDREPLLAAGVPAVLLSDFDPLSPSPVHHTPGDTADGLGSERLNRWVDAAVAVVLRLDRLAGRPRWEDEYVVALGRVWIRRDAMWVGFGLWVVMVFAARPGRWAGAGGGERRARGRSYLPGYAFRLGFLATVLLSPTVAGPLVFPLAPLSLWRSRGGSSLWVRALAPLPVLWLGAYLVASRWAGGWSALDASPVVVLLVIGCTGALVWQAWAPTRIARP
ncbi:MAG: M20/M25/M40 family metallo-hydrolase [Thermoanaerobaculia bacterium]|nr:M20/M25/M40 family metallo-hydrolase [Thermoanaerobaculia bacterium]